MEIKNMGIGEIKPNPKNPRKNDKAVGEVMKSIQECGYVAPIIIDENNMVLAGHTRLKALKLLDYTQVECVVKRGLTEEQKQKYVILDNKLNELADWDYKMLDTQLTELDFSNYDISFAMDRTAIEKLDEDYKERVKEDRLDFEKEGNKEDYWNNIIRDFNLQYGQFDSANKYGIPKIQPEDPINSTTILLYNRAKTYTGDRSKIGMAFYIHDVAFEAVWAQPTKYIELFKQFEYIIEPDFSDFIDNPPAIRIYNAYRNAWLARFYQEQGIKVLPNVRISDDMSFEWVIDSIPKNAPVVFSSKSMNATPESTQRFIDIYNRAIQILNPSVIYVNGKEIKELINDKTVFLNNIKNGKTFEEG